MAITKKMMRCKICRVAVVPDSLEMFEHILTNHALELLREPLRVARLATDPALRRELARQVLERAASVIVAGTSSPAERKK